MFRRLWPLSIPLIAVGCLGEDTTLPLVPPGTPPLQTQAQSSPPAVPRAPASEEAAMRINLVGQKLLAANEQVGLRPIFHTIGLPQAEVFHRGQSEIFITEGLSRQCVSEGQLAAVLALELGKMVSEREALAAPQTRVRQPMEPQFSPVGNDSRGVFGSPDGTRLAELGEYEKQRVRPGQALPPPDPNNLARIYLQKAGYNAQDLESATPLLKAAQNNVSVEKQLTKPLQPAWGH